MNKLIKLDPWFVTGFADAEGSFLLNILRNKELKVGWVVNFRFQISLHQKDHVLLEQIKTYLGVGNIHKHGSQSLQFRVSYKKDLKVIIDHFDKYPLITKKRADYELWKKAFNLMLDKEHTQIEGLRKILAIKTSMNLGLSEELKVAFPDTIPVPKPKVEVQEIKDPNWLAGFTSGEGCFIIRVINSSSCRLGVQVKLIFKLTQHVRDEELMRSLIDYLGCGNVSIYKEAVDYLVTKFSDLTDKVIPFFKKYPILGVKSKDFEDFCKVAELMQNKDHLTASGLDQIRKIKAGMNRGRSV
jgi:hypothetical protein